MLNAHLPFARGGRPRENRGPGRKAWKEEIPGQHLAADCAGFEGRSRDEALKRLCTLARKRLAAGEWEQVSLPGPPEANPWIAYAGIWKDHPDFDDFLKNIADYRRTRNGDTDS